MIIMMIISAIVTTLIVSSSLWLYIPIARRNRWMPWRLKHRNHKLIKADKAEYTRQPVVGGGFVFYVSMMLWSLAISMTYGKGFSFTPFLVGLTILAACSFADDLLNMKVSTRLIVQLAAVLFLCVQFEGTEIFVWQLWLILPLYIIFALYFINCYNFMDGIDGITPAYSIVVLLTLEYLNISEVQFMPRSFILFALIGAVVFSFFNFRRKAMVYAGDVGSISMGYIVLTIISGYVVVSSDLSVLALVSVYIVDTGLTILRRIYLRENIFKPHRHHLYQLLAYKMHWPHLAVASIFAGTQAVIATVYFCLLPQQRCLYTSAVYLLLAVIYFLSLHLIYHKHNQG